MRVYGTLLLERSNQPKPEKRTLFIGLSRLLNPNLRIRFLLPLQRNGRKSLTTVQGLKKEFSYNKILKDLKKEFCCNGTVVQDPELGQVIQLQGDQRKNVSTFLVQAGIVKKEHIKMHGF
ncbi:hypothetical protein CUMW_139960 [Citrus unshiu]|nr:hypothetical protein CUMW_139960 [Citrus unshiu]